MTIEYFRDFLGWCTLINIGLLILMTLSLGLFRGRIARLHFRMFEFKESQVPIEFYRFIAYYKMAVLIFNLVPYLALRVME